MTTNRPPSCDLPPEFYAPKQELEPCPFCGSSRTRHVQVAVQYERDRYNRIKCDECGAYGPIALTESSAVAKHKTRNAIPRRSEVLELIRLVDGYFAGKTDPLDLRICATKLREEIRG